MSMAYPTVLASVQPEWELSATAAGSISSASQLDARRLAGGRR
jgi:hypothetical protein